MNTVASTNTKTLSVEPRLLISALDQAIEDEVPSLIGREGGEARGLAPDRQPDGSPPDGSQPAGTRSHDDSHRSLLRRHPIAAVIGVVLLGLALGGGYLYWDYSGHFQSTDDAFIEARQFSVAPKISGYVTAVPVTDNQHVKAGDVIARIDAIQCRSSENPARAARSRSFQCEQTL